MTLGPLEYLIVGFEGTRFTGRILAELRAARDKGIIRVVDLFAIKKDDQGNVTALELSDLSGEEAAELNPLAGDLMGLFAPEDIEQAAASIPNNGAPTVCSCSAYLGHRLEGSDQERGSRGHDWRVCGS